MDKTVWKWAVLLIIILVIGWGLYGLISTKEQFESQAKKFSVQASDLNKENNDISDQLNYLKSSDANQIKILKEQTSYRPPDQKLIIITSDATSTLSTSTATSSIKQ